MLMEKELKYLKGAVDSPVRPMACIVGGAKVSSKVFFFFFSTYGVLSIIE